LEAHYPEKQKENMSKGQTYLDNFSKVTGKKFFSLADISKFMGKSIVTNDKFELLSPTNSFTEDELAGIECCLAMERGMFRG
jgi:hypothetical protein